MILMPFEFPPQPVSLNAWNRLLLPIHTPYSQLTLPLWSERQSDKICFSFSFFPVGWPNSSVHRSEITRPCGNCRASAGPRRAGQVPGALGAREKLAVENKRLLLWTPPSSLERAWVIVRGPPLNRRNYVKYAHTFLLYNSAH